MHVLDLIALWVLWWCSGAFMHGGPEVRNWRDLWLATGLLLVWISSFCAAIVLQARPAPLPWWGSGIIYGTTLVAAWLYDRRFGITRHLRMVLGWFRDVPHRLQQIRHRWHA